MPITGPDPGCLGTGWRGVPLLAKDVRLRPFVPADEAALVALADDAEVARWTAEVPHPYRPEDARAFIAGTARALEQGSEYAFAVERLRDGVLLGAVTAHPGGDGVAEIGYWIGRPYWGLGYATQAVRRLARFAFADLKLAGLRASLMLDNAASERVLAKAGFVLVGQSPGSRGRCAGVEVRRFILDRATWEKGEAARPMILVVAVALVDADGRVLLARRPAGKSMAGLWEFPGGKVAAGESPEAALVRELKEELAIDITESCLAPLTFASHAYNDFQLLMPLYVCRVWKGTITPREGQEVKWVRPARLGDYPMPPADAPLIAMLRDLL